MPLKAAPSFRPRTAPPLERESKSIRLSPRGTPAFSKMQSQVRLKGPLTQRKERFTAVQADVLKMETGPVTKAKLKKEGFTPQVSLNRGKKGDSTIAFAGPGPSGKGKATGIVSRGTGVDTSIRANRDTARHEVIHHILPFSGGTEHAIISQASSRKGINVNLALLLGSKPSTERVTRRLKSRVARTLPSRFRPPPVAKMRAGLGLEGTLRAKEGLGTQGFQTPHLTKTAATGSETQRRSARNQMRNLGSRLKAKGVDF